ncbi:MAG: hypothetical protein FD148_2526 [Methylocystaceae bacterium]|nr:MAG: hypothetical protein FD148_2526 [Methylocystaceae bacterium]
MRATWTAIGAVPTDFVPQALLFFAERFRDGSSAEIEALARRLHEA